jgi:hypothetical protein
MMGMAHDNNKSTVGLGHTLDLVFLLDGIAGRRSLGSIHNLVSETLRDRLDAAEGSLTGLR